MRRRTVLSGVSLALGGSLAGCNVTTSERTTPGNSSQDDPPTADPEDSESGQPERTDSEAVLVELYDLAADFRVQASQHFDDGRAHWDAADYQQAMRRFTAAEEKFDASNAALQRLTTRLETEGLAGFNVADTAKTHIEHMHSAARNYTQAAVSAADGDSRTAESYRESAEGFLTRAGNHRFADVSAFRAELGATR
jgi:hypothetical protein